MNQTERIALLKDLPFFKGLPEEQLAALAETMTDHSYEAGEIIATENELVRGFFLVASGQVKLYRMTIDGKEQTIYLFGPGEPFCMCGLFEHGRWPANAQALVPTRVLSATAEAMNSLAAKEPSVMFNLLVLMSRRVQSAMDLIESLSLKELPERLAMFIIRLDRDPSDPDLVHLPMTQRELAKVVGASPEAVSRTLRRMADQKLLTVNGREVRLLDQQTLEEMTSGATSLR